MCGINGIVSLRNEMISSSQVEIMNQSISHRGPDACGHWINKNVQLGHVRLSILDLSERANQPLIKNGLVIVFNGEIYNFKELKKELFNVDYHTESDTEVVLELWRKYGKQSLNKLRGMFSFAIYDESSGNTFIVRDHFGIKPLYYWHDTNKLIFSSEMKAITSTVDVPLTLDKTALASSLAYVWVPEKQCIYKEISKLEPASLMVISSIGEINISRYWHIETLIQSKPTINSEGEAVEYLDHVLESSVKAHLVSDVPVNAFLSGGLDSSLIVSMARQHLTKLDCYTIKFSEEDQRQEAMVDDAFYAKKVANELNVNLTTIEVKPDLADLLPKIVHHLDEPIGDSAAINTFLICDAAHKAGVKVLLSGMGADEMFAGYRKHYANSLATKYRLIPSSIRSLGETAIERANVFSGTGGNKLVRWAKRFVSFAGLNEADAFFRSYTYYDLADIDQAFCDNQDVDTSLIRTQHHDIFEYARDRRSLVDAMCYTDINHFMVSLNLTYSDRASMAASTEVRVPFVDREVMDAAFRVSSSLKLKSGTQKYILKKVAEKWLPNEIIYRPKASFTMPLRSWIRRDLSGMVDDYLLSESGLSGRKLLKASFIKNIVDDERSGRSDNAQKIWHLLTLEQWLRNKGV